MVLNFLDWCGSLPVCSLSLLTVGVESVWAAVAAALSVFLASALLSESFYVGKECVRSQNDATGIQSRPHTTIGIMEKFYSVCILNEKWMYNTQRFDAQWMENGW